MDFTRNLKNSNTSIEEESLNNLEINLPKKGVFLNELWNLQRYLEDTNYKLPENANIIFETYTLENWRIKRKKLLQLPLIGFSYKLLCFILLRVFPRYIDLSFILKTFKFKKRILISKAEIMGRLTLAGFEILNVTDKGLKHHFKVKKIKTFDNRQISSGFLIRLPRVGKNGKLFNVYKFRTMHPYSEFIHSYMIFNNGFSSQGKIKDDFRATKWARILRKYWIDEIPQVINLIKGDMKIVGLRPVSLSYLDSLPIELREVRNKLKPGCIPPYVALNKSSNLEDVIYAEKKYIEELKTNRFVDLNYFLKSVFNIIFNNKRSS